MHQSNPPKAIKRPYTIEANNHRRIDPYFWLRERENPEVIEYLRQENEYLTIKMAATESLQQKLFEEMKSRIKEKDQSVPVKDGEYYYYTKYEEGNEYPVFCRKKGSLNADEEVLLDGNILAKGQAYFQFGQIEVSDDHQLLAYSTDTVGRRIYTIYIKNLQTGELFSRNIPNVTGNFAWASDNRHLFYSKQDLETLRSYQILRHDLQSPDQDQLVLQEDDETFDVFVSKSKSKKYLFIDGTASTSTEIYFLRADQPLEKFQSFHPREPKHEYDIVDAGDRFYILTNWEAQNFRIMEAPTAPTPKSNWKELIAHRSDTLIEDFDIFRDFLVLEERTKGLPQIQIYDRKNSNSFFIQYDDPTYVAAIDENAEFDSEWLRFSYESLTTPPSIYEINMRTKEKRLLKEKEILGGFDRRNYQSERLFASAKDGTLIPISLVYRKDKMKNPKEPKPLLLYGYGSYGINSEPYFNSNLLSLLDRGFIYAIAHIRGGSEMGRAWYETGKMLNKMNTFTDFISCAEYLIENSYTSPKQLYAIGGSAGGLLMGAVINMRPDLFHGVVARVAFVDVVTTMLDDSLPLTTFEYEEWGNPNDPVYYEYMLRYSPYDNIKAQAYPHILATTGLHDSQVQYWEPAKWIAKLRDFNQTDSLILLHTEMHAGHGGKSGRFQRLRETALIYSFFIALEEKTLP